MSSDYFSPAAFEKQYFTIILILRKLIKSHNDTKLMRIKIESKMKRFASPITQNHEEIKVN